MYDKEQDSTEKIYSDHSVYSGQWSGTSPNKNLQRQGFGQMSFADRSVYRGQFANGLCDETGIVEVPANNREFPSGTHSYKGQFSKGRFHGFGVFSFSDGSTFEGEFVNGKINGLGRFTFPAKDSQQLSAALPDGFCDGRFEGGRLVSRQSCQSVVDQAVEAAAAADLSTATITNGSGSESRGVYSQKSQSPYSGQAVNSPYGGQGVYNSKQSNSPYSGQGAYNSKQSNSPYTGQGAYNSKQSESPYSGQRAYDSQDYESPDASPGVYNSKQPESLYSNQEAFNTHQANSPYSGQGIYNSQKPESIYSNQGDDFNSHQESPYSGNKIYSEKL